MKWPDDVFRKKRLSPGEAAESFVQDCIAAAQASFHVWLQANLQALANAGVSSERSEELFNTRPSDMIWLAVLTANEQSAIQNLFPPEMARRLYDEVDLALQRTFSGDNEWIPEAVRLCRENPGPDPLIGFMEPLLETMGYDADDLRSATASPVFWLGLSEPLMNNPASDWWKRLQTSVQLNA